MRRELEEEKKKNKNLQDTINKLNNTINQLKQEHNTDIQKYKEKIKAYIDRNEILNNQIKKLSLDNTNLKEEIKKNNTNINSDDIVSLYKRIDDLNKKSDIKKEDNKPQSEALNNNEINNLRRELEDEKKKNKKLQDTINNLNNTISQLKQQHNTDIEKYKKENTKLIERNKELEKLLDEKNKEINDYIFKLNNSSNNEQLISFKPGDKIMVALFMTQGNQDIFNYAMACKSSDLFVRLEEKLYHDFPKYRNYETFFMVNVRRIFRFKTLEENKIKNNDIISLFTNE